MKVFSAYYPNLHYQPWLSGSDSCEAFFSKLRCFVRGKSNLSLIEMLDFAKRIQTLEELKKTSTTTNDNAGET